eukprot:scaffold485_cov272-Pinguiococcus_pyrenoidosus.AAC.4
MEFARKDWNFIICTTLSYELGAFTKGALTAGIKLCLRNSDSGTELARENSIGLGLCPQPPGLADQTDNQEHRHDVLSEENPGVEDSDGRVVWHQDGGEGWYADVGHCQNQEKHPHEAGGTPRDLHALLQQVHLVPELESHEGCELHEHPDQAQDHQRGEEVQPATVALRVNSEEHDRHAAARHEKAHLGARVASNEVGKVRELVPPAALLGLRLPPRDHQAVHEDHEAGEADAFGVADEDPSGRPVLRNEVLDGLRALAVVVQRVGPVARQIFSVVAVAAVSHVRHFGLRAYGRMRIPRRGQRSAGVEQRRRRR